MTDAQIKEEDYSLSGLDITTDLLTKNPEYYTVWNVRRRIILRLLDSPNDQAEGDGADSEFSTGQKILLKDLRFLVPLLQQYPKCYWIWGYRVWVLQQIEAKLEREVAVRCWQEELGLVAKMLSRDERNFHGWAYRRMVVQALEGLASSGGEADQADLPASRAEEELQYTADMVNRKLSNFSAWHQRSILLPRVLNERNATESERRDVLEEELNMIQEALIDPNDQSLWFYHQFLMYSLAPLSPPNSRILPSPTENDRVLYYTQELDRILDVLEDWGDSKWLYRAMLRIVHDFREYAPNSASPFTDDQAREWINKIKELDPLRRRRWEDLERSLRL